MKKSLLAAISGVALIATACGGAKTAPRAEQPEGIMITYLCDPMGAQLDSARFEVDSAGYAIIFDGTGLTGWRGYGRDSIASKWSIDTDGSLHFTPGEGDGGDILFAHPYDNFDLTFEWKVGEGSNSGVFYLTQEVADGAVVSYACMSAPEYQILDNANHPDALQGVDGNRKSASLYDMIPATPQNALPWGEWNTARILVDRGHVEHWQNGELVVEYDIFNDEWTSRLQGCKFSEQAWPEAFALMNAPHAGYIAFQDHGDPVWYRNVRIKSLD